MEDKIFSVVNTVDSKIPSFPIKDGQIIFVSDKGSLFFDFNGQRKEYKQIMILTKDIDRTNILAPITRAFYFVEDTNVLWYYKNGWRSISMILEPYTNTELDKDFTW
ncbi:hypothetical protein F140042L4_21720 [Coprococcus phoceensis]